MKSFLFLLALLVGICVSVSVADNQGLWNNGYNADMSLRLMSSWYDWTELDISGESTNVTVSTKYPTLALRGVYNNNATAATMIIKTVVAPTVSISLVIPAYTALYPLPPIATIVKSGSSDNLILMFQKR
jgi:hypothetical protein